MVRDSRSYKGITGDEYWHAGKRIYLCGTNSMLCFHADCRNGKWSSSWMLQKKRAVSYPSLSFLCILLMHLLGFFSMSCSQNLRTDQPSRRSFLVFFLSRLMFPSIFSLQNFFAGFFFSWYLKPCQKSPSQKIIIFWEGSEIREFFSHLEHLSLVLRKIRSTNMPFF